MFQIRIPDSRVVKHTVKAALKGRRIAAGMAGLIPYLIYLVLISLYGVFAMLFANLQIVAICVLAVATFILFLPLMLGAVRWFWRLADGCEEPVFEVFYYFSSLKLYKRAFKCVSFLIFKCVSAIFICMLPFIIVSIISGSWVYRFLGTEIPLWVAGLALVQSFLRIVGIIVGVVVISRYYLFPIMAVMNDDMLLHEAMHISMLVSKRSAASFIGLYISLIGWILLSVFIAPIFYVAPILLTAYAVHSRFALVNYNQNLEKIKNEQYSF